MTLQVSIIDLVFSISARAMRAEELLESARGQVERFRAESFQYSQQLRDAQGRAEDAERALVTSRELTDAYRKEVSDLRAQIALLQTSGPICAGDTVEIVARQPGDPEIGSRFEVLCVDSNGDVYFNDATGHRRMMYAREMRRVPPRGHDFAHAIDPTISPLPPGKPATVAPIPALPEYCERLPDDALGPVVKLSTYPNTVLEINNPEGDEILVTQNDEYFTLDIPALRAYLNLVPDRGDSPA
jgi:hypothetical protein